MVSGTKPRGGRTPRAPGCCAAVVMPASNRAPINAGLLIESPVRLTRTGVSGFPSLFLPKAYAAANPQLGGVPGEALNAPERRIALELPLPTELHPSETFGEHNARKSLADARF